MGIDLLWDERYADAGWIVRLLSVGAWFSILELTNGSAFLARGQVNMLALANAGKLAGMAILIPLGFHLGGFPGAVTAYAATELFKYVISAFTIARVGLSGWRRDLALSVFVAACALAATLAGEAARVATESALVGSITIVLVAVLVWGPVMFFWRRNLSRDGLSLFGD